MGQFHLVCHDCEVEGMYDERYEAAGDRDAHADETERFEGAAHDVEFAEVEADG